LKLKVSEAGEFPIRLAVRRGLNRHRAVVTAARTLAVAFAIVLLAGEAAWADCTPAAANNVTATCTGTTTNQGGGAPGTSAGSTGYGIGGATGVTVNVIGGSLSGTNYGILVGDGTVTNNASITSGWFGVLANTGFADVTNSGSITGTIRDGINAQTNATVTNNAGASITGGRSGIVANTFAEVTNSGSITGTTTSGFGIIAWTNATVTNNTGASITGGYGINAATGFANVTNSGSITGTSGFGIHADTNATVTNNAGASIKGLFGVIYAATGFANVTNSGSITGPDSGIYAGTNATVTNNAGASIVGGQYGIYADGGFANVTNSGSITGTSTSGIYATTNATVTNSAGASIAGGQFGISANMGFANVTNSGSITGTSHYGIHAQTDVTVTNNAGASIAGGRYGIIAGTGFANVINSGSITGTSGSGIYADTEATVTNNVGASIASGYAGIFTGTGFANVTNSGSITGTSGFGIYAGTNATVTNNAGASIAGGQFGIIASTAGSSSVFNAGTISGGTAAIQFAGIGNTLTLAQGSVISGDVLGTGSDKFQLGGTGAATFDVSQLGPAAQYQGFGTFNKIDSSIWTLTGTSTYAGAVNVNGGTLAVNGDIASASGVTVNAGGTLGGNGIVGNTTINAGGMLAPGNSIGLLTVQGNLVFTAASSYMVEVSPANADRTNVTAAATLGGATVNASFAAGTYVAKQYTILNATGGLGGSAFGPIVNTNLPSGFRSSLSYDADNAFLNLEFVLAQYRGLNGNQQNVANALVNFFNTTGGIPLVFGTLTPAGLTRVSGEIAAGSQQSTFNAMTQFMGVMTDPFTEGRGDSRAGATGFAEEDGAMNAYASTGRNRSRSERDAQALMSNGMITKAVPRAPAFVSHWNVWAAGFGGSQTTDGNAVVGSNTATSRIGGVAIGADYWLSPQTIAGFALAGGGTNFSVADGGSGRSDLFQAGAFVRHNVGSAYITGALAYGWQDVTTDRTVTVAGPELLRAHFNANAFAGRIEGGHRFATPWMGLTPYAAAQVTNFDLPAYAESVVSGANTFALTYGAKNVTATRSELGLRSDKSFIVGDVILTLRGRAAWAHDFNPDHSIAATFQTLPGASFVVNGPAQARDAALTTASAELKFISGISLAATFEGELSNVTRSYAGKGVARYQW
jgi:uncharacterized protein with beta-barrel porin domain